MLSKHSLNRPPSSQPPPSVTFLELVLLLIGSGSAVVWFVLSRLHG
jgi:hypothetical protein